mmetsp:Transcript_2707/g.8336  ORF Transcript_2707/g.8336 Transcript_2707/m.8336 type:complete len:81 (-) Transcript_2707:618-860(-)
MRTLIAPFESTPISCLNVDCALKLGMIDAKPANVEPLSKRTSKKADLSHSPADDHPCLLWNAFNLSYARFADSCVAPALL